MRKPGMPVTDRPGQRGAYRRLLANAAWRRFTLTAGFQRLSVAMAPLALVLAGHGAVGSFRVGALMASAYTFADGIASPWSGRLMDRVELRRGLSVELGAAAVVLAALAGLTAARAPALVLIVLSGLAGAAPAGVMGGLSAYLQRIVPDDLRERAFALDATLLELEWMFAPALVALTGFLGAPVLAIALMALAASGALGGARLLRPQQPSGHMAGASGPWRSPQALPIYFLSAVMGYAEGTINIALAPLMPAMGARPATAGLLIALLSLASAAGGFAYAAFSGHLPGDTDQRANVTLLALGLCAILIAVAPSLIFLVLAVAACGIWFAPLNAMRTLILGKLLPASQLSEGFSTLSAAMQMGYGTSGIATGAILGIAGARACFIIAAAVTIASALGAWLLHHHSEGSQAAQPSESPESHH
jgi:MFS family permease